MIIKNFIEALEQKGLLLSSDFVNREDGQQKVQKITFNSKEACPGCLFVCKGAHFKKDYLDEAIDRGSICYISENSYSTDKPCASIIVSDIRRAMAIIAKTFYGDLSNKLNLVGITGTKGKSSTTYFVRQILDDYMASLSKNPVAVCSGINNYDGVIDEESHLTTPEILDLYSHMNNAINSDIDYLVMEVSSQALKYGRVDDITFAVGCFLNIGMDHISPVEHPDYQDYFNSKLRIFEKCRSACYNLDCEEQDNLKNAASVCDRLITFSSKDDTANVFAKNISSFEGKVDFDVVVSGDFENNEKSFEERIELSTFGTINVENALAAISISLLLGVPFEFIKSGLSRAKVPGRMEHFRDKDGKKLVIVDYAHNKLSYESLFKTIKSEFPKKDIVIVFGSVGDKAQRRREELGTSAGTHAKKAYITEDDHGEESCQKICEEIASFVTKAGGDYEIITDRVKAIQKAIDDADQNTIVIVAGKGRETRLKRGLLYVDSPSDVSVVEEALGL